MPKQPWTFASNPFERATLGSYARALQIGNYTYAVLKIQSTTDPELGMIFSKFEPFFEEYREAFTAYNVQIGVKTSRTFSLKQELAKGAKLLNGWIHDDLRDADIFPKTPNYAALLPDNLKTFNYGKQLIRINNFKVLALEITKLNETLNLPVLAALQLKVAAYAENLSELYKRQRGSKGTKNGNSLALNEKRKMLCKKLLSAAGRLLAHFEDNSARIENYFLLHLIRKHTQKTFHGHSKPGETKLIAKRKLNPTATIVLLNGGAEPLHFWLAPNKLDNSVPYDAFELPANKSLEVTAIQLGNAENNRFLMVHNPGKVLVGAWEVDL